MTMTSMTAGARDAAVAAATQALLAARESGVPQPALPLPDAEAAYAVQAAVAAAIGWFGGEVPGHWKSGGPSRDEPLTHAPLPPRGVWAAPADASRWPFHQRGIEAEVALRLGREVTPGQAATLEAAQAAAWVDAITVSIEIVDSRWAEGPQAPAWSRLADLQSHGALVLGAWRAISEREAAAWDWAAQLCRVRVDGGAVAGQRLELRGSHALADPLFVLPPWLRHATRGGRPVPAGTVVTTGTWCGLLEVQAGQRVHVEFPAIGEASVQF